MSAAFDVVWYGYKHGGGGVEVFDEGKMENVYAGHGSETGGVLCTVEFGLICVRRVAKEEGEGESGVNELNGHLASMSLNGSDTQVNGHGHSHANHNGMTNGHAKKSSTSGSGTQATLARNLLLKPKVLLRSVEEIIWP